MLTIYNSGFDVSDWTIIMHKETEIGWFISDKFIQAWNKKFEGTDYDIIRYL